MSTQHTPLPIVVPDELATSHRSFFGDAGLPWIAALPALVRERLDDWHLRLDGPTNNGAVALVLPVLRADGTPAALKVQPIDDHTQHEPDALRAWDGHGAVRLLEHDPDSGSMLLERLDASRCLWDYPDDLAAMQIVAELLAELSAVKAPPGLRRLSDVAAAMLERVPHALPLLVDPDERQLLASCAAAVADVLADDSGDRLLHWDLHFFNVLAALPGQDREPWVAIDPKPLSGDPGFELFPALWNRWHDAVATGDIDRAVRQRFDLMTEVLDLDRQRARAWTLGRILQAALSDIEQIGFPVLHQIHKTLAEILLEDL